MSSKLKKKAEQTSPVLLAGYTSVLGLDMSVAHTGYCLYNLSTKEKKQGLIEAPDGMKGMERLAYIRDHVLDIPLRNGDLQSTLVLIEGYSFASKGQAIIDLGELGGVIRLGMYVLHIPYLEIPPSRNKKFIGGGTLQKNRILLEVYKRFGEDLTDDNVADATVLMYLGRALVGDYIPETDPQREVVRDVLKNAFKDGKS